MTLLLHGAPNDVAQIVLTLFSLVSMAVFIAWCGLCKAVTKRVPADTDVYGVSNRAATISGSELTTSSHCVQFRQAAVAGTEDVFHSEPIAKSYRGEFEISTRVSAPSQLGRALPRVPTDVVLGRLLAYMD
ncbi:hypothetical protein GCK32_009281 [Trichostrongylus colubriformis]|uniref:Uncharacterized protein n=1 Tax=Trichostrongylus colubriformis TaxID=6319 RepID=A0AAN8FWM7_TRICO